jgi:large subunit ribosomal protein L21
MYAIVSTGGKQYKVQPGDQLKVEKLPGDPGSTITLTEVLAVGQTDGIQLGAPLVEGTAVEATILRTARDRKVIVFKKKRRQGYHKKQGHRQWYTLLRIDGISSGHVEPAKQEPKEEPKPATEEVKAEPTTEAAVEPKPETKKQAKDETKAVEEKTAEKAEAKSAPKAKAKKEKDQDKAAEEKPKATKAKAKKTEKPATKADKADKTKTTKTKSSASKADSAEKKPKAKPKKKSAEE